MPVNMDEKTTIMRIRSFVRNIIPVHFILIKNPNFAGDRNIHAEGIKVKVIFSNPGGFVEVIGCCRQKVLAGGIRKCTDFALLLDNIVLH